MSNAPLANLGRFPLSHVHAMLKALRKFGLTESTVLKGRVEMRHKGALIFEAVQDGDDWNVRAPAGLLEEVKPS